MIVIPVVFPVVGIPIIDSVGTVHEQIQKPGDDNSPQNDPPNGDGRDLERLRHALADSGEPKGWDQKDAKDKGYRYAHGVRLLSSPVLPTTRSGHDYLSDKKMTSPD
jgi:hypothetical protein